MNDMPGPKAPEERQLFTSLLHAAAAIENRLEREVEAHGLSLAKLSVLEQLKLAGGSLPLGQLAEELCCVRSNVTQLVDRLEAAGLVRRMPDPQDRRSTLAAITAEGRQRYREATQARSAAEREILASLPAEQRERLCSLLEALHGGLA